MKQITKVRNMLWKNKSILICALLGAIIFVMIYGVHILNPCYTDWLLTSHDGDLTQHYLGWKFYRHGGWKFPFGLIDTIAYPNLTSVIFTDSIPLFAFFFKAIRFILPPEFQYFGWFGLFCFMLQGGLGAVLVKKYLKNTYCVIIGGLFFVLCPVFIDRMFWMTSLAAHFLCLIGLIFIVYYEDIFQDTKKAMIGWGILGALCSSIHIYFLPMCGVLLLGFMLIDGVKGNKKWKILLPLFSFLCAAVVTIFLFGGFMSGMQADNSGLGYYSFNLNGFFNPQGWSFYLKDMPVTDSQYEGFAYLGLGMLILLISAVIVWIGNMKLTHNWISTHIKKIALCLVCVVIIIMAASNVVMYHDKVLFEVPILELIRKLWSIFRASGRLIWPVIYLLILGAICVDGKTINVRTKGILLTVCLLLQIGDIKGKLSEKNEVYNKVEHYQTLLPSEEWIKIGEETDIKHICFVSDITSNRKLLFSFGDYASDYGLTLSNFYFARSLGEKELIEREKALAERKSDTIFIFSKNEAQKGLVYDLYYYGIDGLILGCSQPIGEMQPLTEKELTTYHYDMDKDTYFNNGEMVDEDWVLHSYGNTYGPRLYAEPGRYQVLVEGSNLTAVDIKCYYKNGVVNLPPENLVIEDGRITYEVELTEHAEDLEFALWNVGGNDIVVSSITIEKQ